MSQQPPNPRKKTPAKRPASAGGPPRGPAGKRKLKPRRKPKKSNLMPQIVAGVTLLGAVTVAGVLAVYFFQRAVPEVKPPDAGKPDVVARPAIQASLEGVEVKRPGLALAPDDEVYFPKALDVTGTPFEPSVNGLLTRNVITVFADGKFRPNDPLPRAEFLVWCYNAVEAQTIQGPDPFVTPKKGFSRVEPTGEEFGDTDAEFWAAPVLASLKASKVFDPMFANYLRPNAPLTREEWAGFACLIATTTDARAALGKPVNDTKLAVALRKLNYTDPQAIQAKLKPYVNFIVADDKRRAWLADSFAPPLNPGPWNPRKPVTRGEAATWLGGAYEEVGTGMF